MKGYTVFNVEQIDGLPEHYYAKAEAQLRPGAAHRARGSVLCRDRGRTSATAATRAYLQRAHRLSCRCRPSRRSAMPKVITRRSPMR